MSIRTRVFMCAVGCVLASPVLGAPVLLTFEGLQDREEVNGYYGGGFGGDGSGPGPNVGVFFSTGAQSVIDFDAGGTGNTAFEPSGDTVLSFTISQNALMNVPSGFTGSVSTWYSSISATGTISVFDGLNGTGNLLAFLSLTPLGFDPVGDPNGSFNRWAHVSANFAGTALSVVFGGLTNQIAFDNIEFSDIVPAPGCAGMLAALGLLTGRRRRA